MTAKTHLTGGLIAGAVAVQLTEPLAREQFVLYGLPYELESLNRITEMLSPVLNSPIGKFFNPTAIILIVFVLLGSLFPDIDHRNSKIGKKVKPLSILFNKFLGHRGIFHSWFLYNILYIAIFATYSMFAPAEYHYIYFFANTGFYIGCLSHLILDTFNKTGVPWLFPLSTKKISLLSIKTGETSEAFFQFAQIGVFIGYLVTIAFPVIVGF